MARLRCAPELIAQELFGTAAAEGKLQIIGAGFDAARGEVVLMIVGEGVPDVETVECEITEQSPAPWVRPRSVKFTAL